MKKSEMAKFKLYRGKTLIGKYPQLAAHNLARNDAIEEISAGRNPTYVIVGPFGVDEHTRIGKFSHGRIYWKFAK